MAKYNMTVEDNILFAKRNLVDTIWKEAGIEGIGVTYPDTKEIFEGRAVSGLSIDDTVAINNLKRAWRFVLDHIDVPIDLSFVRQVNGIVGAGIVTDAGNLRNADVSIGGTRWKPTIPDFDNVKTIIESVSSTECEETAMEMFCELCRMQLFYDGNKRTAQLVANKMLIASGSGILAIPHEHKREFETLLVEWYETNTGVKLKEFLVEHAIDGIATAH